MLPASFIHKPPKGYDYEVVPHKSTIDAIWIVHLAGFNHSDHHPVRSIWGFYDRRKESYRAPINSSKPGDTVDVSDTTPYSAMQIKKPLRPIISQFT